MKNFEQNRMRIKLVKQMILVFQNEMNNLEQHKNELFWEHFYLFCEEFINDGLLKKISEEYESVCKQFTYAKNERNKWIRAYYKELKNL